MNTNKVALITGGAKGIGAATARRFLTEGFTVAVVDRDEKALAELAGEVGAKGGRVTLIAADVTVRAEVDAAVERTVRECGGLDVLVNNAGVAFAARVEDHSDDDWQRLLAVNLSSAFYFVRAAVPALRKSRGTIVNVSSMTALVGQPRGAAYTAAKAGLNGLTRALALELAEDGIRCNAVCPAGVDTPLMRAWAGQQADPAAILESQAKMHVLGRLAAPEEIAEAIWFLGSPSGSFITGTILEIEGGATLGYRKI